MNIKYLLPIFLISFISCTEKVQEQIAEKQNPIKKTNISTKTQNEINYSTEAFYTEDIGWGYVIFKNNKAYINQPHIPAISGNNGFTTKIAAEKVGEFVIYKLEKGILPPSVSIDELDSLEVLLQ